MNCPFCQGEQSRVVDSRTVGDAIRRRRECEACQKRYSTLERLDRRMPQVVKKDGKRSAFDLDKVRSGFTIACRKRPVDPKDIDAALLRIEARIFAVGEPEISSQDVGRLVLEELRGMDNVAFLRFASVYLEFDAPEQFLELIQPLLTKKP
ncbi:MAG: transcriptional repressor NrdR [Proteobacteria bacterium]|nr:transcriptional repressor NrdR [Pseudomonadota bacterium]MCP4919428.1 transcriptional repressor NrdR [Pseudomonadota bacterium]